MPKKPKYGSLWDEAAPQASFSEVKKNLSTEVCVIGAGITGLSVGYKLALAGKKVVIVDKGKVGWGETGVTTAHLSTMLDDRYFQLEKLHGLTNIQMALESQMMAVNVVEGIVQKEKISCNFKRVNGYLFFDKENEKVLDHEVACLEKMKYKNFAKLIKGPKGADLGLCLQFQEQGEFHPLKYLMSLAKIFEKKGGKIYENSFASEIKETSEGVTVHLEGGHTIKAESVVVATNVPFNDKYAFHMKQAAFRTYVIAVKIGKGEVESSLLYDTEHPYHYVRLYDADPKQNYLIVGGEDHKTGQPVKDREPYEKLLEWTKEKFPFVKGGIEFEWSGQVIEPIDGLAFIGLNPGNKKVYLATGYSGSGMTYSIIAGEILSDLILGKKHPWAKIYDPQRRNIKAAAKFIEDGVDVTIQYMEVFTPKEHEEALKKLPKNAGMIIKDGSKKIAAYKDPQGKVCKFSAVCPHLGCLVHWNRQEKSWDCPCHGSRFDKAGKVLNGPANRPLDPA